MEALGVFGSLLEKVWANRAAVAGYFDIVNCKWLYFVSIRITKFKCWVLTSAMCYYYECVLNDCISLWVIYNCVIVWVDIFFLF